LPRFSDQDRNNLIEETSLHKDSEWAIAQSRPDILAVPAGVDANIIRITHRLDPEPAFPYVPKDPTQKI